MIDKTIYLTGIGLQLSRVGILERSKNDRNILTIDLRKLVNSTKSNFMKARGIGTERAERLDHVRKQLVKLLVTNN